MRDIALIGAGYWGKNLARVLSEAGRLAVICDPGLPAAEVAARHGVERVDSLDQILSDASIRAALVATPAVTHYEVTRQLLESGRDVFVEKPLSLRAHEARHLCTIAERERRVLMVGHLLQYHPGYVRLRQLAADGRLGKLQYVYSHRLNFGRIRTEENILWSFAPHDISMILGLAGQLPVRVGAIGHHSLSGDVADVTTTHFEFADGLRAHVFVSWLHPSKEQRLVVVGDRGMAVFDDTQPLAEKLIFYPYKVEWEGSAPQSIKGTPEPIEIDDAEPLRLEVEHFLERVEDRKTPRTDGEEGLRGIEVLNAAQADLDAARAAHALAEASRDRR